MTNKQISPARQALFAVAVLTILVFALFGTWRILSFLFPELTGYPRWGLGSLLQVLFCLAGVMLLCKADFKDSFRELGLTGSVPVALLAGIVATLPMVVIFAVTGPVSSGVNYLQLLFASGIAPFAEEVMYRGFAFWLLYRYTRLGFWISALLPSLLFAWVHLGQTSDPAGMLMIGGIMIIGGLWFSWLLMKWQNLWVPFAVHALMNFWWEIFVVDTTAIGGWLPNLARLLTVIASVVLTLYWDRIRANYLN